VQCELVKCLDLTQDDDLAYFTPMNVPAQPAFPTAGRAMENVLKKRLMRRLMAAKNKKRYKAAVIDLTVEDLYNYGDTFEYKSDHNRPATTAPNDATSW
jgi:hypothetical protein